MYTSTGVTTDAQVIKEFLARDIIPYTGWRDTGFLFNQSTEVNKMPLDIKINDDTAYVTSYYAGQAMIAKYLPRPASATELVLQRTDTTVLHLTNNSFSFIKYLEVAYYLEKNNTAPIAYPYPDIAMARYNSTLLQQDGKILLPMVRAHFHLPAIVSWYENGWLYLNTGITTRLQPGDTLVVQTKWLELVKQ